MNVRTVFMGSPEFALPVLDHLVKEVEVVGVVTQPDRPAGRGQTLTPPPVKTLAHELGLPVIQPKRLRETEAMEQLHAWQPDLIVVAAFGQILRPEVLDLPKFGCINVHASLLPRWRGAAPIQAAILHGDPETGVSIMLMDPGIDTGPILSQQAIPILPTDTAASLSERLAMTGADLLSETLPRYLRCEIQPRPQPEEGATYAPMLKKEDGLLNFGETAQELERRVRAFNPWPGAYTPINGQVLKILRAHAVPSEQMAPEKQIVYGKMPALAGGRDLLVLDEVQPAGKKPMPGEVFLRGHRNWGLE